MANFLGKTRYSLWKPGSTDWRATNGTLYKNEEEYRSYLFSKDRLRLREEIFIGESLPLLAQGSRGHNYRHIVSYSADLPRENKERLFEATERFPFLVLDEQGPYDSGLDPDKFGIQEFGAPSVFGVFRLDDDDILSTQYFDLMAPYIKQEFAGMQVTMPVGFSGLMSDDEIRLLSTSYYPKIALGLLGVHSATAEGEVTAPAWVSHIKSDRANPVIFDSRHAVYFRGLHATNDTALTSTGNDPLSESLKQLNNYPRSSKDEIAKFKDFFGGFARRLVQYQAVPVFEGIAILDDEIRLDFPHPVARFTFEAEVRYGEKIKRIDALLRFELMNEEGEILPNNLDIGAIGIARSSSPKAGYFRYIYSSPGLVRTSGEVELPPGVFCTSVTLVRWGDNDTEVILEKATLAADFKEG